MCFVIFVHIVNKLKLKIDHVRVEKQRLALQEKIQQQQHAKQKEIGAAKLKADLEDQLKQQRLAMQLKRQEQQKDGTKPQLSILQKITGGKTVSSMLCPAGLVKNVWILCNCSFYRSILYILAKFRAALCCWSVFTYHLKHICLRFYMVW